MSSSSGIVGRRGWAGDERLRAGGLSLDPEIDVLGLDRAGRTPRRRLVLPIEVRVRDDLVGWGRTPSRLVLRRVSVAHESRVVTPYERAVERRADARICLRADHDEPSDSKPRQDGFQSCVLEGVAVVLLDERLGLART